MLDQRLVRENPTLIAKALGRRGMNVDLTPLQLLSQKQKSLEEERSNLQAESNRIGKEVGQRIKSGVDPKAIELVELRQQGNLIKQKVALLEEDEKAIATIKEVKKRAKLTTQELKDVAKALKEVGNQIGDIDNALKGEERKGRKNAKK